MFESVLETVEGGVSQLDHRSEENSENEAQREEKMKNVEKRSLIHMGLGGKV